MNKYYLLYIILAFYTSLQAQYTSIPDTNFEQALIDLGIDSEGILDGQVLTVDIASITGLNVVGRNIEDMTGIKAFTALEYLNACGNNITHFDLSDHQTIINLDICTNPLTSVNLENAIALETLRLFGPGQIGDNLNVTNCTQLKDILAYTGLTSVDFSTNIALESFEGGAEYHEPHYDMIEEFDFSNNPNLHSFAYVDEVVLQRINFNNNNNSILTNVYFFYELDCVQVDDANAANNGTGVYANWDVPSEQSFSEDCYTIGIEEDIEKTISITPNPVSEKLCIVLPNELELNRVCIYNSLGEHVYENNTDVLDVSYLPPGLYFVKIEDNENRFFIKKVIKI